MKKVSIISPVYEKVQNLSDVINKLAEIFKDKYDYQVLCYYYGQLPGTLISDSHFVYYRIEDGQGYDDCVTDGFSKVDGDCVIVADVNNENYLEYLQNLLKEWENNAEIVLVKEEKKKLNFIQKVGKFFVNLFNKTEDAILSFSGLYKDTRVMKTFQLFTKNVAELIKEFPEKNYYMRNFDSWGDYRVAILRTKEVIKVERHDKVWTNDLIWAVSSFGVSLVLILVLSLTANLIVPANRAMYVLIGIGLILASFLFGLRNFFFWFVYRKTRIKREKNQPEEQKVDEDNKTNQVKNKPAEKLEAKSPKPINKIIKK